VGWFARFLVDTISAGKIFVLFILMLFMNVLVAMFGLDRSLGVRQGKKPVSVSVAGFWVVEDWQKESRDVSTYSSDANCAGDAAGDRNGIGAPNKMQVLRLRLSR
jgi:hypothetical protein